MMHQPDLFPPTHLQGRPTREHTMLKLAATIAERSTCRRRKVGCVLVDEHGRLLSMGHNGVPMGQPHCLEHPCKGAELASGVGLDLCHAVHAEQNALLFCQDVMKIESCYVTTSCCVTCVKILLNTSCQEIVFLEEYPHADAKEMWVKAGRLWKKRSLL